MKLNCVLAVLLLIADAVVAQECIVGNCDSPADISAETRQIIQDSEDQIRKSFWYFLRGSRKLYSTIFEGEQEILMFFIHRNIVGTFQTISSYDKETQQRTIKNLVRLGNGASQDVDNEANLQVQPAIISIQLNPQQYLVARTAAGEFEIVGAKFDESTPPETLITDAQARLPIIEEFIEGQFPQYLTGSSKVTDQTVLTTQRVYFLITYINELGLYLAIGSNDSEGTITTNTFVRLGAGSRANRPQPIQLQARVITLQ